MSETESPDIAVLKIAGKEITLPVHKDTQGEGLAIDITPLSSMNLVVYDLGGKNTATCQSGITYLDGEKGILLYRGYPIEQIARHCTFLETAYLLLKGELPAESDLMAFKRNLKGEVLPGLNRGFIHEQMVEMLKRYPRQTHPMLLIQNLVGALEIFDEVKDYASDEARDDVVLNLIAKMPTIVAASYRYKHGLELIPPSDKLEYVENFIHMCFATPGNGLRQYPPVLANALDKIFILHADHEQNASTAVVRSSGSTGIAPHTAIANGIATLWGAAHGGANEKVLKMLQGIKSEADIDAMIKGVESGNGARIPGFGHAVYKTFDPRAAIIRQTCHDVLEELHIEDPLFGFAQKLEQRALDSEYFQKRNLYPNVDFYSGIIMKALGFPETMFTPLFALARTVGWVSQWSEMVAGKIVLARPRQRYIGPKQRNVPTFRPDKPALAVRPDAQFASLKP